MVLAVSLVFHGKQLITFSLQGLNCGELFYTKFLKSRLCRLVQSEVGTVFLIKLFRVACLAVVGVNISGFGIVKDVLFKTLYFSNTLFSGLDLCVQLIKNGGAFFCFFL